MNQSNIFKRLESIQETEAALLEKSMKQAYLTYVEFSQQNPVIQTKPKEGKSVSFIVEQIELSDNNLILKGHDRINPFNSITYRPDDFFPGEIAHLLDFISGADKSASVSPRGVDNYIQAAIITALEYLDDELDAICDEDTYENCEEAIKQLRNACEWF